ncbi:MAG: PD-(D/E)XK nuclease family protein [Phycisphaerae bacterium]|nr:PD-(D/E)XK nuclease family protein [Phycisphaerae bacterium]
MQDTSPSCLITRIFLGSESRVSGAAAAAILAHHLRSSEERERDQFAIDLSATMVVVPGTRAGRLLLHGLLQAAAESGLALDPPTIVTSGALIERLFVPGAGFLPAASALERRLAWGHTFASAPRELMQAFVPRGTDPDHGLWDRLAMHAVRFDDELAAGGRELSEAVDATERCGGDSTRCRVFAELAPLAAARLREVGLATPRESRAALIARGTLTTKRVYLVGVLELGAAQRVALALVPEIVALIPAVELHHDRFDALGCPTVAWADAELPVPDDAVVSAHAPRDQAEAALQFIAQLAARHPTLACDQIAIGLGDAALSDTLHLAGRDAGISIHDAAGSPVLTTPAGRTMRALDRYRTSLTPEDFAALLRRPVIERWLRSELADAFHDPLGALDRIRAERLPATLHQSLGEDRDALLVTACVRAIDQLLASESLEFMMRALPWEDGDKPAVDALQEIDRAVRAVPALLREDADVTTLVLQQAGGLRLPEEPRERAVEALGWLELHFEPAPHMVLIGMNEGNVPAAGVHDPLLPESLRERLGLPTRCSRAGRDAMILHGLLARTTSFRCVVGRVSGDGEPLLPSRLLLALRGRQLAVRVAAVTDANRALAGSRRWRRPAAAHSRFVVPQPPHSARAIASMGVTAFRDYLACGMRFWLSRIERLRDLTDDAREIALPDAGTVMHEVLHTFGRNLILSRMEVARDLAAALHDLLDQTIVAHFGLQPLPVVRLQLSAFRQRIDAFARWQVEHARAGWQIRFVEEELPGDTTIAPEEGALMSIRGRIDRIDFHPASRTWRIIDYKTNDAGKSPRDAHREGSKGDGDWKDLQLPLYHHGFASRLRELEPGSTLELGYVRLPADPAQAGWCAADFSSAEIDEAIAVARTIVGAIRRGEFPLGDPSGFDDPFGLILQTPVFDSQSDAPSSEGDE